MDLVNRRSVIRLAIAALLTVVPVTSTVLLAEDPVSSETTVPPRLLPWGCSWSVTCLDGNGLEITMSGTEYAGTSDRALRKAEDAVLEALENCSPPTPPSDYPKTTCGPPFRTSGLASSEILEPVDFCSPACQCTGDGDWVVHFECSGKNGGSVSTSVRGRTYCEALAMARASVCRTINSPIFGGACRCCSRVVERPLCYQRCAPRKKR